MFNEIGLKLSDIQKLDYWQFFGYQKIIAEKDRKEALFMGHMKRITRLLFWIAKSEWIGLSGEAAEIGNFFQFEKDLESQAEKGTEDKKIDPLEGKGKYEMINGEKEWIYNMEGINDLKSFIDGFNRK